MATAMSTECWTRWQRPSVNRPATRADLFSGAIPFLGLGFGTGLIPRAPGTFGTLAAIPLAVAAALAGQWAYLLVTLLAVTGGVVICEETARLLGAHDHAAIVWDEIAGFLVTMLLVPMTAVNVIAGFILFRLFDILKPWPIRRIDRQVGGGLGIILDDLVAGLFAALTLLLLVQTGLFGPYTGIS